MRELYTSSCTTTSVSPHSAICVHDHVGDVVVNTAACRGLAGGVVSINCGVSINWVPVEVPYGYHTEAQYGHKHYTKCGTLRETVRTRSNHQQPKKAL